MHYVRDLPGGGHVEIQVTSREDGAHARLVVERRSDPRRRQGHTPPVVAEATGATAADVFDRLHAIARDNVAVARALIRWQANRLRTN